MRCATRQNAIVDSGFDLDPSLETGPVLVALRLGSGAADRDVDNHQAMVEDAQDADEVASFPTIRGEY